MRARIALLTALLAAGCGDRTSRDIIEEMPDDMAVEEDLVVPPVPCRNGVLDGAETDVDCGGPVGAPCADGRMCLVAADCTRGSCYMGRCGSPPSCTDNAQNGSETDVDCGGMSCPACADGKKCMVGADCASKTCANNLCAAAPSCTDGILNNLETDIDCGGPKCKRCGTRQA